MKKRLLSCLIVMAMLVSAVCLPVSASVGKLTDLATNANVIWQNKNEVTYASNGAINGSLGPLQQHSIVTFAADTESEDAFGTLSFKIKADAAVKLNDTSSKDAGIFILEFKEDDTTKQQADVFIMDYTGYMRSWIPNVNNYGLSEGTPYELDKWYTVAMTFNKDKTYDTYIDGQFIDHKQVRNQNISLNTKNIRLLFNVCNGGKYYVDDLTWSKYNEDGFYAQNADGKTAYASGKTVKIQFSEILASADVNDVKLYECATGNQVAGAVAELDGDSLNVTLPAGLKEGAEYRIEMNNFVGATGRTLETDNIYFNCALGGNEPGATYYLKADTFGGYENTAENLRGGSTKNYYKPSNWYIKQRWHDQNAGVVMAQDGGEDHGTVMQVGKTVDASSSGAGKSAKPGVYLPFGEKVSNGVLTISYDVKPQYLSAAGQYNGHINGNLITMVYGQEPTNVDLNTNGDSSTIQECNLTKPETGRPVYGIVGYKMGSAKGDIYSANGRNNTAYLLNDHIEFSMTDVEDSVATTYPNASWKKVSDNAWHNVKMEFDFDSGKITWYLDGVKKDENATLMSDFGLNSGICGLSFGQGGNNNSALCLIDNVVVTKTLANKLGAEAGVYSADFNNFENNTTNGKQLWGAIPADGVDAGYAPKGWAVHQIWTAGTTLRQYGTIIKAGEGKTGNGIKFGKQIINDQSRYESPVLYQKFDKTYTDGVINISYDIKAEKLANAGDAGVAAKLAEMGTSVAGWGFENVAPQQFYFSVMHDDFSGIFAEGFVNALPASGSYDSVYQGYDIFGIQNGKMVVFTGPIFKQFYNATNNNALAGNYIDYEYETINNIKYRRHGVGREDISVGEWYNIKHIVDIDNNIVTTIVDGIPVASVPLTDLCVKPEGEELKAVTGFRLGGEQMMYGSEMVVDNIVVTRQEYVEPEAKGGVMQVRFADYYSNAYGVASSQTTLTEAIGISFWAKSIDAPDKYNFELYETNNPANTIGFKGNFDSENDIYLMELDEYLTKDTAYTLKVKDLSLAGAPLADYTMNFKTNAEGELVIEPIYIKHNNVQAESGTLAENDTLTSSLRIINTTGVEEDFAFSMAVYSNGALSDFDFEEISLDGTATKSADIEVGFKLDKVDAANVSSARVFLWDGMNTMKPVTLFGEFVSNK